jgi:myosin heavy subunit
MEKGFKELYSFSVDRETEKEISSTKKDKKTGDEIKVTKKVKTTEPLTIKLKKPSRRELEDAELEFSVEMSKCIKKGILTKAMLAKKYSDTGGLMSEDDAQELVDNYKKIFELQSEYSRLEIVQNKTEKQTSRVSEVAAELQVVRRKIVETESNYQSLFDHTADVKAQNRLILWYVIMLTHVQGADDEYPKPYFGIGDFDDKLEEYYKKEETDDSLYFLITKKAATIFAFWFFNQASDKDSFDDLMKRVETGDI